MKAFTQGSYKCEITELADYIEQRHGGNNAEFAKAFDAHRGKVPGYIESGYVVIEINGLEVLQPQPRYWKGKG